ncbi:MAG: hypothetical protein COT91_05290 [Candidatus Doudnabacteria bacterium CG10_big_fil_rev_8_21_14_0_10_41_10]|uniref:CR-type domain-containing protein n=1 Tax=Candidatus Doudnabacteria bacterium CG10_big_fil_rev_8_21_14_0_10_41_10 TaxID=1974551 RepID=A0A2H0VC12_9BACT|nr:MAG: hypothetical protein COT91_05290 [Candidatus Doudnabacteria bacterium CG10_big_fil_rev_8_21_14_0_10_41_10]
MKKKCKDCETCGKMVHVGWKDASCQKCSGGGEVAKGKELHDSYMCPKCVGSGKAMGCECGRKQETREVDISHAGRVGLGPCCAIATASLGHHAEPELEILRGYRDQLTEKRTIGKLFSAWYEKIKRPVARYVSKRPHHK